MGSLRVGHNRGTKQQQMGLWGREKQVSLGLSGHRSDLRVCVGVGGGDQGLL